MNTYYPQLCMFTCKNSAVVDILIYKYFYSKLIDIHRLPMDMS